MKFEEKIATMKCLTFDQSRTKAISVFNQRGVRLGSLVPVGKWILDDERMIESIRAWRQNAKKMFLTQFESTFERTYSYLNNLSINEDGRLFFMLYDDADSLIGHIGISGVNGVIGELDNLMRGADGGDPRLIYFSEIALLDWCFKNLGIKGSSVRVLSYNWLVLALHEEVGYFFVDNKPLKKYEKDGVLFHDEVDQSDSNVKYSCTKLMLIKSDFYDKNHWLP